MHESFQRLLEVANELNQEEIARRIDELPQTLTNWKRRGISKAGALKISAEFSVSANWILTGEKIKEEIKAISLQEHNFANSFESEYVTIPYCKEPFIPFDLGKPAKTDNMDEDKMQVSKSILKKYNVNSDTAYALTAIDDSMSPVINNQAIVFVDLNKTEIIDGKIYAISHGGLFKFKYLYRMPKGGVRLVSANKQEYPEVILTAQQIIEEDFCIIAYAFNVQNPLP